MRIWSCILGIWTAGADRLLARDAARSSCAGGRTVATPAPQLERFATNLTRLAHCLGTCTRSLTTADRRGYRFDRSRIDRDPAAVARWR